MLKKYLFATVLLTSLPSSYVAAYPDWDNDLAAKTKVAIYCGFGIPNGENNTYKHYDWKTRDPVGKVDISPNIGLGLVLGVSLHL
jgi:hypothetical protein